MKPLILKQDLLAAFRELGMQPGMTVMVHTSLSSMGYDKNTSLYLADARTNYPGKHLSTEHSAVMENGQRVWKAYDTLYVDGEDFSQIGEAFEQEHTVSKVQLGNATLRLMRQRELVDFAVKWIEQNRKCQLFA